MCDGHSETKNNTPIRTDLSEEEHVDCQKVTTILWEQQIRIYNTNNLQQLAAGLEQWIDIATHFIVHCECDEPTGEKLCNDDVD